MQSQQVQRRPRCVVLQTCMQATTSAAAESLVIPSHTHTHTHDPSKPTHSCAASTTHAGLPEQPPHAQAAGQQLPSDPAGLDGWLLSQDAVRACFHSMSSTADISLVEGCVGMFDSPAADGSEAGSTAQVAAWLHLPVVLIVDTQAFNTPRSILALVRGYAAEDGSASVAGLILNKTQKQSLAAETQDALRQAGLDIAVLGGLPLVGVGQHAQTAAACLCSTSCRSQLACPCADALTAGRGFGARQKPELWG